jgi:Xaa-Pro aminopeptidase
MSKIAAQNNFPPSAKRLQALWDELEKRGLEGFIIPHADEFQGEYVPAYAQRLAWLTGFTGSAGLAIVHRDSATIFVDGRYTLAVREQIDTNRFKIFNISDCSPYKWLSKQKAAKLGYDAWLHTPDELAKLKAACKKVGSELISCENNPIDAIWTDQPEVPLAAVIPHPLCYAGETSQTKREKIAKILIKDKIDATVLTTPDSIAWLLNIRGGDVPYAPLPLCFAILYSNSKVDLFLHPQKIGEGLVEHLGEDVTILSPDFLANKLQELGQAKKSVLLDTKQTASWIFEQVVGAKLIKGDNPCLLAKACKNQTEITGMRAAHHRDGIALTRFLYWLNKNALNQSIDEMQAAERLEQFRLENDKIQYLSFETISAAGANAAIVHYQVSPKTNRILAKNSIYLVDSGGQYLDGTTDVTRTVVIGKPTAEQKTRFTQVLKGHIAIASCRFPKGTTGSQLDILARHALWQAGVDYQHGTGHGVGCYLSVHEGPQSISQRANHVALKAGMVISNEPGYYKEGAFGIRIENLVLVTEAQDIKGGENPMLGFETLTLAPIDLNLVEISLLDKTEIAWLNDYHQKVFREIGQELDEAEREWLMGVCL